MKRPLKYLLYTFGAIVGLYLILLTVVYIYVTANKKSIIDKLTTQLSAQVNGDIAVKDFDLDFITSFPSFGIALKNVSVHDSLYAQHKHEFFRAEKIFVGIRFLKLFKGQVLPYKLKIENAGVYFYTDTAGYTNTYLLNKKKTDSTIQAPKTKENNILQNCYLQNVNITINDLRKEKLFDFDIKKVHVEEEEIGDDLVFHASNDILIKSLGFNLAKGTFLRNHRFKGKFDIGFNQKKKQLSFATIPVEISKQKFTLSGEFNFTDTPTFAINVSSNNIKYEFGRSLLSEHIAQSLSLVTIEKPFNVKALITGPLNHGEPLVKVDWDIKANNINTPMMNFTNCTFTGGFTNEVDSLQKRNDANSRIQANNFTGNWEGITLTSNKLNINRLDSPILNCDIHSATQLKDFNTLLGSDALQFTAGTATMNVLYNGPLSPNPITTSIVGDIKIKDGQMLYGFKDALLKNCNGNIVFAGSDVLVKDFNCVVSGNNISMWGEAKNLVPLLDKDPEKAQLQWNVASPVLNLDSLTKLFLPVERQKKKITKSTNKLAKTAQQIDQFLSLGNVNVNAKITKLIYQKFIAQNVVADLSLIQSNWLLNKVALQHGDGNMFVAGSLYQKANNNMQANVSVKMEDMDIKKVMYGFNNFGQSAIAHQNLKGKLNATAKVTVDLNNKMNVAHNGINGKLYFSLKKGALENYEPLQKLQSLLKKRDFDHVEFAEIKDSLLIDQGNVTIKRMEIQSTVLSLFIEGLYSFDGSKTDIRIQVPLSNLKNRDSSYVPTNKGSSRKGGLSVFVRGSPDKKGDIQFRYDLLGRFRKKKDGNDNL